MKTITWVPKLLEQNYPIEIRPSIRTVTFVNKDQTKTNYRLAFPYMQFFLTKSESKRVTWSLKSVSSLEDEVAIPLLPNVNYYGWSCCPGGTSLDFAMNFWQTQFTPYEMEPFYKENHILHLSILKSFKHWQELTNKAIHPLDVFQGFCSRTTAFKYFFGGYEDFVRAFPKEIKPLPMATP